MPRSTYKCTYLLASVINTYLLLQVRQLGPAEEDPHDVLLQVRGRLTVLVVLVVAALLEQPAEDLPGDESEHPQRLRLAVPLLDGHQSRVVRQPGAAESATAAANQGPLRMGCVIRHASTGYRPCAGLAGARVSGSR